MANYLGLKVDANQQARAAVPDLCYQLMIDELNARLTLTLMESTATITVNAESEALPADFREGRHLYLDTDPRRVIQIKSEFSANACRSDSGMPAEAVVVDGALLFAPTPDGEYTAKLRYLASLPELSADTDTSDVMDAHYGLYLFGALKHYAILSGDDAAEVRWTRAFETAVAAAEKSDTRKRYGASPLTMTPLAVA